jgi:translation initiation factor eIF-2B subunit epsilon
MNLKNVFEKHKQLRKADKTVIMTAIFKKASPHHRSRAGEDATILAVDKSTQQLLYYDNSTDFELTLENKLLEQHNEIELRYDLIDCRIDICSPQVLHLFQDEFDWKGYFILYFILF